MSKYSCPCSITLTTSKGKERERGGDSRLVTRRVLEVIRQVRAHVELKRIPNRRINLVRLVRYLEPLRGGRN
jgi:predicted choloylglycine hydrolase